MRIKLDENVPADLKAALSFIDDVDTVADEGLSGRDDDTVWQAAQREGRFFVTQDLDFSDLRKFTPGSHRGVLLIRLNNPSRQRLTARLTEILSHDDVETWAGCFVVATESKLRVRRP